MSIWQIAQLLGSIHNDSSRLLADIGITVEYLGDRRRGEPGFFGYIINGNYTSRLLYRPLDSWKL
jgi:hypothetical protein